MDSSTAVVQHPVSPAQPSTAALTTSCSFLRLPLLHPDCSALTTYLLLPLPLPMLLLLVLLRTQLHSSAGQVCHPSS
jgi:hypothetical protein